MFLINYFHPIYFVTLVFCLLTLGCKGKKSDTAEKKDSIPIIKKDTSQEYKGGSKPPPIINITDTIAKKLIVLYIKDSSSTSVGISRKLAFIFRTQLPGYARLQNLETVGPPMVWYKSHKAPFFFEAGLPVNKIPGKLQKNTFIRNIGGDSAVVAHFYGPYEFTIMAYEAVNDWFKSNKKKPSAPPYEIYVNDPFDVSAKPIDAYRIQTDIIFPRK